MKRAVVIAHGELEVTPQVEEAVRRAELIVAADGGAAHALSHGWWPHLLVGDLDSASPGVRAEAEAHGAQVLQYSPQKDETDTELALRAAVERGAMEICLLGAAGNRLDHTLANVLLLAMPQWAGVQITLLAGRQRLSVIRGQGRIAGQAGDLVSLLPLGGDATGIWTTGLEYPLRGDTLPFGIPRGISNVLTQPTATVRLGSGLLLAVVTEA